MYKRVAQISSVIKLFLRCLFFTIVLLFVSIAEATDQGRLGKTSSASVDISVTVNQTLNSVSPNELLLSNKLTTNSTEPFCVTHQGYNQNARVPYELIVDSFKNANNQINKHAMPFNVYFKNENIQNSKQQLTQGLSISTQSDIKLTENIKITCADSGLQLFIEQNNLEQNSSNENSIGIMVLLISPT